MPIMNIKNFTFTYPGVEHPSLRNINLPIEKNKITALIGPSGCGKSTLLRAMNRIHDVYPGNQYDGEIILKDLKTDSNNENKTNNNESIALNCADFQLTVSCRLIWRFYQRRC